MPFFPSFYMLIGLLMYQNQEEPNGGGGAVIIHRIHKISVDKFNQLLVK
jgi:hypothetical protein